MAGIPIGGMLDWPCPQVTPELWLPASGQSVLRATYGALFNALNQRVAPVTITNASPAVVSPGFAFGLSTVGSPVFFTTTGALPTGITANTTYYIKAFAGTTFTLGTGRTINVITGVVTVTGTVNTSTAGSGVHTLWYSPFEVADATHFYLPDPRGRVIVVQDNQGDGTDAGVITWANVLGLRAGEQTHTILTAEAAQKAGNSGNDTPDHSHPIAAAALTGDYNLSNAVGGGGVGVPAGQGTGTGGTYPLNRAGTTTGRNVFHTHPLTGSDAASPMSVMQPSLVVQKIIYSGVPSTN